MTVEMKPLPTELIDALLADYKKPEDLIGQDGILKQLTKALVERALQAELAACAALSQGTVSVSLASLQTALRLLAKRLTALNDELRELDTQLARLTKKTAPRLLARFGVGPQTAATLLTTNSRDQQSLFVMDETLQMNPQVCGRSATAQLKPKGGLERGLHPQSSVCCRSSVSAYRQPN